MGVVWEIIGWLGTGLVVLSMAQQRITRLRILNLAGAAILTVYNLILGVWPMVALNAALSVIQLYHLNLLFRSRHDAAAYDVVTAAPTDDVVTHVIAQHHEEIRAFHPQLPRLHARGVRVPPLRHLATAGRRAHPDGTRRSGLLLQPRLHATRRRVGTRRGTVT